MEIDILIEEDLWLQNNQDIAKKITNLLEKIIQQTSLHKFIQNNDLLAEIAVILTNDDKIWQLNKEYRHRDKPTNVLSFPALDGSKIKNGQLENLEILSPILPLGDIVISYQTLKKECSEQNKIFDQHLTHLLTHSLLHLIGFDHENDEDAEVMENLEIKILAQMGIDNPYV
jgi:probable rRNA maturation factor